MGIKEHKKAFSLDVRGKGIGNAALLCMSVAVLGLTMTQMVAPSYMKLQGIWQQRQQQKQRLERIARFANQHADYQAYEAGKFKELVHLKQKVQQLGEINQLSKQLQLWAVKQRVEITCKLSLRKKESSPQPRKRPSA